MMKPKVQQPNYNQNVYGGGYGQNPYQQQNNPYMQQSYPQQQMTYMYTDGSEPKLTSIGYSDFALEPPILCMWNIIWHSILWPLKVRAGKSREKIIF